MKTILSILAIFIFGFLGNAAFAEPSTASCEAVKEKAWKAKQILVERQQALQIAQGKTRLAYAQLVECRPGAVFSAGRAQRCAHAQSDVPLQVQVELDAEHRLDIASVAHREKSQWVARECALQATSMNQTNLLFRISALEAELTALKTLMEELND